MLTSGISSMTTNQALYGQTENTSTKEDSGSTTGWKYVTVTEGDIVSTYIVIGKNMKVLIGKSPVKEEDKDKNNGADKTEANGNSAKTNAETQNNSAKPSSENNNFLSDYRMLGLTGYYQKKIRETMVDLENHIGCDKIDSTAAITAANRNAAKKIYD